MAEFEDRLSLNRRDDHWSSVEHWSFMISSWPYDMSALKNNCAVIIFMPYYRFNYRYSHLSTVHVEKVPLARVLHALVANIPRDTAYQAGSLICISTMQRVLFKSHCLFITRDQLVFVPRSRFTQSYGAWNSLAWGLWTFLFWSNHPCLVVIAYITNP